MNKSLKWICGLCTYENYPTSLKCVMCNQPYQTPFISEPRSLSEMITEPPIGTRKSEIIPQTGLNLHPLAIEDYNKEHPNYHDTICTEFQNKARISYDQSDCDHHLSIDGAGAASGASSNAADKNNEINKKWQCLSCTYMNWNRSQKCIMCQCLKLNFSQPQNGPCHSSNSQPRHNPSTHNSSQPCSPQPGACGRLCHSSSSNMAFRSQETSSLTPPSVRSIHRHKVKKSYSEENLNNIMNAQDFAMSRDGERKGRHFSSNGNKSWQHEAGISRLENYTKSRDFDNTRSWKKSNKRLNWLFLKAWVGILEDNIEAVDRYLMYGGNIARPLTAEEVRLLNRPSAFDVGHTIVHLAVRFQRNNILALILTPEVTKRNLKRSPAVLCPEIADHIGFEILNSIRIMKGDFHCQYFCDYLTFLLPIEIAGLPSSIQRLLFDELLDKDVQKELEDELAINCYSETDRLYALWNRSAGDCLLDSVLQATWGVFDRDNVLRKAMAETLQECSPYFYTRWKEWEVMQANLLSFSLSERQYLQDWAFILSLARQPGASLEHCHIFVLSHILRRPIIVYGVKYLKNFQGDTLGFAKFQGVYLPFLWERSFCWKSPIALGYTRGHFTALVTMENDLRDAFSESGLESTSDVSSSCTYLPLMDCDRKLLPIHFTSSSQSQLGAEQECILYDWLDCLVTNNGVLVAKQKPGKRPPLVTRMLDQWLDHYRHLSFGRLGEDGDTEDEE